MIAASPLLPVVAMVGLTAAVWTRINVMHRFLAYALSTLLLSALWSDLGATLLGTRSA